MLAMSVTQLPLEMIFSAISTLVTGYFWLVRSRAERPSLTVYQLMPFRATVRSNQNRDWRRLMLTQLQPGGVLVANNSTLQNSIVRFDCYLELPTGRVKGDWGYSHEDGPPWNLPPQTTIKMSPACFFDVPDEYEAPEGLSWRVEFITVSGKRFGHTFTRDAPDF